MTLRDQLRAALNDISFACRQQIAWSRPGYTEPLQRALKPLNNSETSMPLYQELIQHYPHLLDLCKEGIGIARWRENLNFLAMLHQARPYLSCYNNKLSSRPLRELRILEIGVKNWGTLPALLSFARASHAQHIHIDGVEIDIWALYRNGHSRYDALQYHLKQCQQPAENTWQHCHIRLIHDDILAVPPPQDGQGYDLIVWSLPFVSRETHLAWGLPERFFGPLERLLSVSKTLLAPQGSLVTTHQGWDESREQTRLAQQAQLSSPLVIECQQPFLAWRYPRILNISHKQLFPVLHAGNGQLKGAKPTQKRPQQTLKAF